MDVNRKTYMWVRMYMWNLGMGRCCARVRMEDEVEVSIDVEALRNVVMQVASSEVLEATE